jgi:hypothetical protein
VSNDEDDRYHPVSRPYEQRFPRLFSDHVFDKLRSLDLALGEFVALFQDAGSPPEVIAEAVVGEAEIKELVLLVEWKRPLHVAIVVDGARQQERVATVYEPYSSEWTADYRRRRS